jgi:hypothetical protein
MSISWTNEHFLGPGRVGQALHVDPVRLERSIDLPDRTSGDQKNLTIRLADTADQRNSARMLVNRKYAWRGYGDSHHIPASSTHMTFTAEADAKVIGTITLGVDSPAGLAADAIFRDEINTFRRVPGAKVCELTKLAFDTDGPSKPVLAALFHIVFICGQHEHQCTDLFIEVNPRHRRFYQAMLGFRPIGTVRQNESVAAPAQLMWLKVADIRAQIDEHAGRGGDAGHSLYPFFFSLKEELGLHARLTRSTADGQPNGRRPLEGGVIPVMNDHRQKVLVS